MGKKLRDEDLRLNIIINGDNGRKEMAALERSIHDTNAKLEALYATRKKLEQQGKADTAAYRRVQMQIGKYNKELDANREKLAALRRQQSVNTMTLSELRAHINRVQTQLNKTDPKTPLWAQLNAELKMSKARMAELSAQSKVSGGVICNMAERINRYIGLVTAGFAGMTFVFAGINRARGAFNEYDEALVDAMKTTDLTRDEITGLSRDLAEIDTRTAQNDLLGLVRIGGKLGIKGRDNLLQFAGAADKINVALKEDLGGNTEDAIREIGKLIDIFNLQEEYGLERAMLMTGSAINELGMASTANEGYIVEFTKRVAGIAPNADISIDKILGLAATLDKYGQMSETSATAVGQTIVGMYKKTNQFAKVAKMSYKDFRELLSKDANEAFIRVLEGMNKDADGMFTVVKALDSLKLNGQRAQTVLGSLSKHSEELRNQQEISNRSFMEGTSIIDEFKTKNESATATMEKHKKAVVEQAVALGQKLTPAIGFSLSASTWSLKIIGQLVSLGLKYKTVIIALTVAYATNTAAKKVSVAWDKVAAMWKQRKIILSSQYRIALAREAITIHETRNAENAATKATMLWCAAKNLLVWNLRAAALAMKAFFVSMGPVGWATLAISALVSIVGGLVSHYREAHKTQRLLSDSMKKATTEAAQERAELDRLKGKLEACKKGTKEYNDTKAEIIRKFGKYDSTLKNETLTVTTLRDKYDSLTSAIMQAARARQYNSFAAEHQKSFDTQFGEISDKLWKHLNDRYYTEKASKYYNEIVNAFFGGRSLDAWLTTGSAKSKRLVRQLQELRKEQKKMDDEARARFGIKPDAAPAPSATPSGNPESDGVDSSGSDYGSGDDGKWSLDKDALYQQKRHALKKQYLAGEITTEKEYNSQLLALDIATLQRRLALNVDDAEQRAEIQNTLDDKLLQQRDQNNKWTLDADETYLAAQLDLKNKYLNKEIASEAEYDDLASQLEITALQNRLDKNIEQGEERTKLEQQLADKLLAQQRRNAQRQAEADEILADAEADKIAQENRRYQLERQKFAGQSDILAALQKRHERRIAKIRFDEIESAIKSDEEAHKRKQQSLKNQQASELLAFTGTADEKKKIKKRHNEELAVLDAQYASDMAKKLQELLDNGNFGDLSLDAAILSDEEKDKLTQKLLAVKEMLISLGIEMQNIKGTELNAVSGTKDLLGFSLDDWDTLFDNLEQGKVGVQEVAMAMSAMANVYATYDKLATASENRQLKEFKKNNDAKKKDLQRRLDLGLISQDQYNTKVGQLDEAYEAKQEELQLKQSRRQKALSIIDAIINTAVGVTAALKLGPIIGPILAAMIGAMGAVQIGLISSQPINGAEEGGFQGVTRKQDGRRFKARLNPNKRGFIDDPTLLVAENGTEYVIPNDGLQNPSLRPFINTMETARRNGTLRSLNFESVYPMPYAVPGRATGGFTSSTTMPADTAGGSLPFLNEANNADAKRIIELLEGLNKKADNPTPAIFSMLGRGGFVEEYNKYLKLKRNGQLGQ